MITGVFLGALAAAVAGAAVRLAKEARWTRADAALLIALVPLALYAVRPYVSANSVGAGDSHHYALQVADFIAQERSGLRPIFVGGSEFQFNGGVHTVRTAPYFTHLAGLLDLVTLRRLSAVQLQNLAVATTSVLAAFAAYLVALHASGRRREVAWLLAATYVLSPGIYGPLTLMDMFATYMAAPALVLAWYGLVSLLAEKANARAHFVTTGALGLLWYAHSPIAVWCSLLWMFALAVQALRPGQLRQTWRPLLLSGGLLATLALYVWVSVALLDLGPTPTINPPFANFSWSSWGTTVGEALRPYTAGAPFALQLGLPSWLLLAAALTVLVWRREPLALFTIPVAVVLLLLFPWPWVAEWLWRTLPQSLVAQMTWPGQRFYPLLAAAAVVLAARALRATPGRWLSGAALALGVLWSAWQISLLHTRPGVAEIPPAVHREKFSPENLSLSRYSYAYFAQVPDTFTHSWTDPEFELRLVDEAGRPVLDNFSAVLRHAPLTEFTPITVESVITLDGPREYLVEFAFPSPEIRGEVEVKAPGIRHPFTLPASGGDRAFGAGPQAAKATPLSLRNKGPTVVVVVATEAGVSYRVIPYDRAELPIRLRNLQPLQSRVRAPVNAYLETPRLWIDGYAAEVNGQSVPIRKSGQGLVLVPVPAGESEVTLSYPGPALLHLAWYVSLLSLGAWPWLVLRAGRRGA
jgi:hypothetical protein